MSGRPLLRYAWDAFGVPFSFWVDWATDGGWWLPLRGDGPGRRFHPHLAVGTIRNGHVRALHLFVGPLLVRLGCARNEWRDGGDE